MNPLWRRAPLVLFRYPGLILPLAVGSLLLAFTAAAYPLFIGASAGALLRDEIGRPLITRYGAGVTYTSSVTPLAASDRGPPLYERRERAFAERAERSALLGPTISQVLGPQVSVSSGGPRGEPISARLFAGSEATEHVDRISGGSGPGAWLPDLVAGALGAQPGDTVSVAHGAEQIELEVAGVYRSLYARPPSGYWLTWDSEIYPYCPPARDCAPAPPQFILLEPPNALSAYQRLGIRSADFAWIAPVAERGLTRQDARSLAAFTEGMRRDASEDSSPLGRILACCRKRNLYGSAYGPRTSLSSEMGHVLERVERRLVAVEGPAHLIQIVSGVVALAVLAGAAAFASSARTTEIQLLAARGHGPLTVGLKGAVENVAPSIIGGAVGVPLAIAVVGWIVRDGPTGTEAAGEAVRGAAVAVAGSILIGAVVGAAMSRLRFGPRARVATFLTRVPWELAILALAFLAVRDVQAQLGSGSESTLRVRAPPASLFLLPVAAIGALSVAGARVFRSLARRWRERSDGMRPSSYLALHRLADSRGLVLLLFAAAGLSMGVFIHGQTIARSLAETVDAKAGVFVGSDFQASVPEETEIPPDFPLPATKVVRVPDAGEMSPGGVAFDVVGVDPETLASAATWRGSFAELPLSDLVGRLIAKERQPVPVIVVGKDAPEVRALEIQGRPIETTMAGRADAFPGMLSHRPTIVIDIEVLERTSEGGLGALDDPQARTEVWIRGEADVAQASLGQLPFAPSATLTADEVKDIPYIAAVIDMFGILNAVGLGAAILVVAALLMYLQARGRSQLIAYGLSLRMGMGHGAHRRSLLLETASLLSAASLVGVAVGLGVAYLLAPLLDPLGTVPPEPFILPPSTALVIAVVGIAVSSWAASWLTAVRARRAMLGEVLRVD